MDVADGRRSYLFNGKARRLTEMVGNVPAVLFTPDDLDLVKGPSERRRDCLDSLGRRLDGQYRSVLSDYQKTLRQRNSMLKEMQRSGYPNGSPPGREELAWEESLAELGAHLGVRRQRLFTRLMAAASIRYGQIADGERLEGAYNPSYGHVAPDRAGCDAAAAAGSEEEGEGTPSLDVARQRLLEAIALRRTEERARGLTLIGPHKDEVIFQVNGREARGFASQGQQRSVALAMKVAEIDVLRDVTGKESMLLMDDVLSELDSARRSRLLSLCQGVSQSFITTTDLACIPASHYREGTLIELAGGP
jgi:DNA replication and repair protein RecF